MVAARPGGSYYVRGIFTVGQATSIGKPRTDNQQVDQEINLWRVADGGLLRVLKSDDKSATGVVFLGADDRLASCGGDKNIRIWNVTSGSLDQLLPQPEPARCLAYEPRQRLLAWGRDDGNITVWNLEKHAKVQDLASGKLPLWSIAFSPDGETIASAGYDWKQFRDVDSYKLTDEQKSGEVSLWDIATGKRLHKLRDARVETVAFSHYGRIVASGGKDRTIKLWGVKSGAPMARLDELPTDAKFIGTRYAKELPCDIGYVNTLAFAPKGDLLITGGDASFGSRDFGELIFWDRILPTR